MKNIIVVGTPSIGHDIAIYLAEHNIRLLDINDIENKLDAEKVLIINNETKLSDLIQVIEMEKRNTPILITCQPNIEEPTLNKEAEKPFYDKLYSKGGKKRGKGFVR